MSSVFIPAISSSLIFINHSNFTYQNVSHIKFNEQDDDDDDDNNSGSDDETACYLESLVWMGFENSYSAKSHKIGVSTGLPLLSDNLSCLEAGLRKLKIPKIVLNLFGFPAINN